MPYTVESAACYHTGIGLCSVSDASFLTFRHWKQGVWRGVSNRICYILVKYGGCPLNEALAKK